MKQTNVTMFIGISRWLYVELLRPGQCTFKICLCEQNTRFNVVSTAKMLTLHILKAQNANVYNVDFSYTLSLPSQLPPCSFFRTRERVGCSGSSRTTVSTNQDRCWRPWRCVPWFVETHEILSQPHMQWMHTILAFIGGYYPIIANLIQ